MQILKITYFGTMSVDEVNQKILLVGIKREMQTKILQNYLY